MGVLVIFGTETGNAEMVAEEIAEVLEVDFDVSCQDMASFSPEAIDKDDLLIVVSSTYGDGELPYSAQPFFDRLETIAPDLAGLRFATFGLGDSFYDTFNEGSRILADKLLSLGAFEICARGVYDASSGELPDEVAQMWLNRVVLPMMVTGTAETIGEQVQGAVS